MESKNNYQLVLTEDNTHTLYSPLFDENCHSLSGAQEETQLHYIKGCQIESREASVILEVGFGLGLGFIETKKALKERSFTFISLEIDPAVIEFAKQEFLEFEKLEPTTYGYYLSSQSFELYIVMGDARESLVKFMNEHPFKFHAIYQDAFSPKKNPTLWTTQWFKTLHQYAHPSCIMSTYSSSVSIRKSMLAAGWSLQAGASFGKKRSSTRADLSGQSDTEILKRLSQSSVLALEDPSDE